MHIIQDKSIVCVHLTVIRPPSNVDIIVFKSSLVNMVFHHSVYREEVKSIPSGVAEHVSPVRRLSLPSPGVSSVLPLPYRISPRGTSSSC